MVVESERGRGPSDSPVGESGREGRDRGRRAGNGEKFSQSPSSLPTKTTSKTCSRGRTLEAVSESSPETSRLSSSSRGQEPRFLWNPASPERVSLLLCISFSFNSTCTLSHTISIIYLVAPAIFLHLPPSFFPPDASSPSASSPLTLLASPASLFHGISTPLGRRKSERQKERPSASMRRAELKCCNLLVRERGDVGHALDG